MMTGPTMVASSRGDMFITTWRRTQLAHIILIQCSLGGHCSHLVDTSRHSRRRTCDYSLYCRHYNALLPSVSRCNSNKRLYLSLNLSCPIYRAVALDRTDRSGSFFFIFAFPSPIFPSHFYKIHITNSKTQLHPQPSLPHTKIDLD